MGRQRPIGSGKVGKLTGDMEIFPPPRAGEVPVEETGDGGVGPRALLTTPPIPPSSAGDFPAGLRILSLGAA